MLSSSGVSTGPGQSALTRMSSRANCTASSRHIASTAPFEAVYEIWMVAAPRIATKLATLITEPPPRSLQVRNAVLAAEEDALGVHRLHAIPGVDVVSSIDASSSGEMPALL